jgi:hypothetical protein
MMKLIELILDETMLLTGIDAISLVEYPAIEEDFIALNSQRVEFATQSDEKRILMGEHSYPTSPSTEPKARRSSMFTSAKPPSEKQARCSFRSPSRTTLRLNTR